MTSEQIDGAELWKTILDDAGLETLSEVPVGIRFRWFPIAGSKDFSVFEVGKPLPVNRDLIAFALFQNESEARVYCCSVPNENPSPPHRITLSKTSPVMFIEMLALDTFIDQVSSELQDQAESISAAAGDAAMLAEAIQKNLDTGDREVLVAALKDYEADESDESDELEETEPEAPEVEAEPNGGAVV